MHVRDLVDDPALALDVRVTGDLDRPVRWVHTIEVPDPGRFLRGGEVVLTAGVWRAGGVSPERFVHDLRDADVAAVGFGVVPPRGPPAVTPHRPTWRPTTAVHTRRSTQAEGPNRQPARK